MHFEWQMTVGFVAIIDHGISVHPLPPAQKAVSQCIASNLLMFSPVSLTSILTVARCDLRILS